MTRKEFWEWMNTCPTHKWDILEDDVGHCRILFPMNEDPEENETPWVPLIDPEPDGWTPEKEGEG